MVLALILFLVLIVFLALFVGFNLSNVCTLWFFKVFENLPVSVLVLVSFAAGIICSLLCLFITKIKRSKKSADKRKVTEDLL